MTGNVCAQGHHWLEWSVPPECPPASVIEARVVEWLGGPLTEPEQLAVRAHLTWRQPSWHVAVDITYQGHHGQRQVMVSSCQDAADFVAVAVVLTVDPTAAQQIPEADATNLQKLSEDGPEAQLADVAAPAEPRPSAAPPAQDVPPSASPPPRTAGVRGHVTLEAEGSYGPLPGFRPGVSLGGGIEVARHVFMLNARWLPGMNVEPAQASAPILFALVGGRLAWSYPLLHGDFSLGPLVSVSAGSIITRQGDAARKFEFWGAAGVGGTALVRLGSWAQVVSELEFEVPFTRPSFVLSDGSRVHQVSWGGRGALGVRFFFPAR